MAFGRYALIILLPGCLLLAPVPAHTQESGRRWDEAYAQSLREAAAMFNAGDAVSRPQLYELGRVYVLRQLRFGLDQAVDRGELTPDEGTVLRATLRILAGCNAAGGCSLTDMPSLDSKAANATVAPPAPGQPPSRVQAKAYLSFRAREQSIASCVADFLAGSPSSWRVLSPCLTDPATWRQRADLALTTVNAALLQAAQLFGPGISPEDFPGAVPPAVRVECLRRLCASEGRESLSGQAIVDCIRAYERFAGDYGLYGWEKIAQDFLRLKQLANATLADFVAYAREQSLLLREPATGRDANAPLSAVVANRLDEALTPASIFAVPGVDLE